MMGSYGTIPIVDQSTGPSFGLSYSETEQSLVRGPWIALGLRSRQIQQEAQEAKLKYLESKSKNDDDFFRLLELRDKDQAKLDREWKQVHRINDQCRELREEREVLLAAAKKRARDSTVVESTIVRKLVQRCHQCSLCSVCEHTHERYRRSKYGDDNF